MISSIHYFSNFYFSLGSLSRTKFYIVTGSLWSSYPYMPWYFDVWPSNALSNFPSKTFILGEPFTQEEMEEMLSAAVDPDKGIVYYKDYVSLMAVEDSWNHRKTIVEFMYDPYILSRAIKM